MGEDGAKMKQGGKEETNLRACTFSLFVIDEGSFEVFDRVSPSSGLLKIIINIAKEIKRGSNKDINKEEESVFSTLNRCCHLNQ